MKTLIVVFITWFSIQYYNTFNINDYRDNYIGNYTCKKTYRHLNSNNQISNDTSSYIFFVKKSILDSVLILVTQEGEFSVKLIGNNFKHDTKRFFGKFSGDSIYVNYIPSLNPTSYRYIGKK